MSDQHQRDIHTALGLFASCVRGGERWSPECEIAYEKARVAIVALAAPQSSEATARLDEAGLLACVTCGRPVETQGHPEPVQSRSLSSTRGIDE